MRRYGGPARNKDDGSLMLTKTFGIVLSFLASFIDYEQHNENGNHQQNVNKVATLKATAEQLTDAQRLRAILSRAFARLMLSTADPPSQLAANCG